ncbi:uncharacterized protein LOC144954504, partial [Lampetra fluviatilis]
DDDGDYSTTDDDDTTTDDDDDTTTDDDTTDTTTDDADDTTTDTTTDTTDDDTTTDDTTNDDTTTTDTTNDDTTTTDTTTDDTTNTTTDTTTDDTTDTTTDTTTDAWHRPPTWTDLWAQLYTLVPWESGSDYLHVELRPEREVTLRACPEGWVRKRDALRTSSASRTSSVSRTSSASRTSSHHHHQQQHHHQQHHHQQERHPMEAKLNITAGNITLSLILVKNRMLLPRYYTDTHYLDSGEAVITPLNHSELCYYHGHVFGVKSSLVSLSTCHGVRALIGLGAVDATFELLPVVDGGVVSGHVLLRMGGAPGAGGSRRGQGSRVKRSQPATCGVVDDPDGAERPRVAQSQGG